MLMQIIAGSRGLPSTTAHAAEGQPDRSHRPTLSAPFEQRNAVELFLQMAGLGALVCMKNILAIILTSQASRPELGEDNSRTAIQSLAQED